MRIKQRVLSLLLAGALLVPGLPAAEAAWGGADLGGISATVRVDWPQTLEALRDRRVRAELYQEGRSLGTLDLTEEDGRAEGIRLLLEARAATGLPIVTEIMDAKHLPLFEDIDIIQVGARNMQNFELLKELGKLRKPVLIKRGMANTLQELLMSAEYVMAGGNDQVILCERGIRTFETATRNTMDLSVIPVLHQLTHLPVVVDPSHATGRWELVAPMALGATACGADGLIIEVHNDPEHALCDGPQSLRPEKFAALMRDVQAIRPYADRSFTFPAREK